MAHEAGRAFLVHLARCDAGNRLDHRIINAHILIRAIRAKAGDAAIDQARIEGVQPFPIQTQPRQHTGAEIFHQHVRRFHQRFQHGNAVGRFQIKAQALLAAVDGDEHAGKIGLARAKAAHRIAAWAFDLDHLGTLIAQHLAGHRARNNLRAIDDADARQRSGHEALSVIDVDVARILEEQQHDHQAHRHHHDRVPQAGKHIAG